jgi:plastocyanin
MKNFVLLLFAFACLSSINAQVNHQVNAGNFYYNPSELTINVGDTVTWVNDNGFHDVNATTNTISGQPFNNPENFASTATSNAVLFTRVFTVAGTYNYDCSVGAHAANGMVGKVIVDSVVSSVAQIQGDRITNLQAYYRSSSKEIQLSFELNLTSENATLFLYDIAGQIIQRKNVLALEGINQTTIALKDNIAPGIYFLKMNVEGINSVRKIAIY